jgi:hypothetical protein
MFTREDYISIAKIITGTEWNDENSVEKNSFRISQFQGTIFPSDYQCFKVERDKDIMVAKITNRAEYSILELLKKDGFPVPDPISYLVNNIEPCKILLFEQYLFGNELGSDSSKEAWQETAIQLAKLHLKYWGADRNISIYQQGGNLYEEKWKGIVRCHYFYQKWSKVIQKILLRFSKVLRVIGHGDAFPTNILVHDGQISFVDLSNSGVIPYMADIARLTCLPGPGEDTLLCPCREAVLNAYYKEIRQRLRLTKQEFLFDVKLASFIELAANYIPPVGLNVHSLCYKSGENRRLERMLCSLSDELA